MTFDTIQVCSEWQVRAGCLATGKLLQEPGAEQSLETVRGHESALSPATRGVSHQVMMMIVIMIISDHCGACTGCTERTGARWGQHTPSLTTPEISSLQLDLSSRKSNLNPRYHFIKEERYIKAYKSFVVSYGFGCLSIASWVCVVVLHGVAPQIGPILSHHRLKSLCLKLSWSCW